MPACGAGWPPEGSLQAGGGNVREGASVGSRAGHSEVTLDGHCVGAVNAAGGKFQGADRGGKLKNWKSEKLIDCHP